jgi:hypothetical protein
MLIKFLKDYRYPVNNGHKSGLILKKSKKSG